MAFDPVLGGRFLFDEADLAANAEGRVSPEQERMFDATVRVSRRQDARARVSLAVVFLLVGALVVVAVATTPGGSLVGGLFAGGMIAWILAIIAFFRRRARRYTQALEEDGAYRVHYISAPDGDIPLSIERA